VIDEIERIVGSRNVLTHPSDLEVYSEDSSDFRESPVLVVLPGTTEEVVGVVKVAAKEGVPIIPRGAGTNPCGQVVGRGLVMDMTRMDRIMEVSRGDFYCRVQPGVVLDRLNKELENDGLFFPPDPASAKACTIGGMVANNSSGLHSIKYGTTKDYVLGLEVVLSTGEVIRTGSLARKSSSGYNLTRLLVGSEGTLGVITEAMLRLLPVPEARRVILYGFMALDEVEGAMGRIQDSTSPSGLEVLDEICLLALNRRYGLEFQGARFLLTVEYDGDKEEVKRELDILRGMLGPGMDVGDPWSWRKNLVPALGTYKPGLKPHAVTEDISVPVSRVCEAIRAVKAIYGRGGFEVAVYGHGGDGNLHMRVLADEETLPRTNVLAGEVYAYVLSVGGSITAEHGVGLLRAKYMEQEHGRAMGVMRKIKKVFDPCGIMNPGKMGL
jgi:glycolate oxidase subunit GlcD